VNAGTLQLWNAATNPSLALDSPATCYRRRFRGGWEWEKVSGRLHRVVRCPPLVALCRGTLMQLVQDGSSALAGLPRRRLLDESVTFLPGETYCSKMARVDWLKSAMLSDEGRKVVSSRLSSASTNHDTPTWHNKPSTGSMLSLCNCP
jgi:hypothetical protein